MEKWMNRLQLKALVASVLMEVKHGSPIARNAIGIKNQYKEIIGVPKNISNMNLLAHLRETYRENNLLEEFDSFTASIGIKL